jgi:hypothetical protein
MVVIGLAEVLRVLADDVGLPLGKRLRLRHKPFPGVFHPVGGEPWLEAAIDVKGKLASTEAYLLSVKTLIKNELVKSGEIGAFILSKAALHILTCATQSSSSQNTGCILLLPIL